MQAGSEYAIQEGVSAPSQSTDAAARRLRIALVQMPFAITAWPSLGLSLLKAIATKAGHRAEILYFNQAFQAEIGTEIYGKLARGAPQNIDLLGEWLFSAALFGADPVADEAYLEEVFEGAYPAHHKPEGTGIINELRPHLGTLREKSTQFVDRLAERDWGAFDVVGFTSTFQQHVAALALAKRIKDRHPQVRIIFGGANCEAGMGRATLRLFPFIDAVCLGEGDVAWPAYLAGVAGGATDAVDGILARGQPYAPAASADLNGLPYPDFEDFFAAAPTGDADYAREHRLIFESSRGCWWGQKNHCTFCGLNGSTMAFRRKDGARALAEIQYLLETYGGHTRNLTATDNIIPYDYFKTFLPDIAALSMEINLFYETKANLKKDQVALYRAAGLRAIQPGIESLSTPVLKLMRKGVSALQNLQLLKWCSEYGVEAKWNFLAGFPGEEAGWYEPLADLVCKVRHLAPPTGVSTLRFDRFSPYHDSPETFGLRSLRPYPSYGYVYRNLAASDIGDLAYYFHTEYPEGAAGDTYAKEAFRELNLWKDQAEAFALFHVDTDDGVLVFDVLENQPRLFRFADAYADVFWSTDQITPLAVFQREPALAEAAATLIDLGLLVEEDDKVLNVSVPLTEDLHLSQAVIDRLRGVLDQPDETALIIDATYITTYSAGSAKRQTSPLSSSSRPAQKQEAHHG